MIPGRHLALAKVTGSDRCLYCQHGCQHLVTSRPVALACGELRSVAADVLVATGLSLLVRSFVEHGTGLGPGRSQVQLPSPRLSERPANTGL